MSDDECRPVDIETKRLHYEVIRELKLAWLAVRALLPAAGSPLGRGMDVTGAKQRMNLAITAAREALNGGEAL